MDRSEDRSPAADHAERAGRGLSPDEAVEDMVRHHLYGPHMRWNVEPAVPRQGNSTILPSLPPAANRS